MGVRCPVSDSFGEESEKNVVTDMTETMDRRAARTRGALHQALMSLILSKGYDTISVSDIVEAADIGRSTFYAHYTGKEDLLRSGFQLLRRELEEARRQEEDSEAADLPLSFSLAMFEHAGRYRDAARALVGGRGGVIVQSEIRRALASVVRKDVARLRQDDTIPGELRVQFVVGAFLTVLDWWLERKPGLSPGEVDAMFRRLVLASFDRQVDFDGGFSQA
jgi:AcrR family transcriptional regulator